MIRQVGLNCFVIVVNQRVICYAHTEKAALLKLQLLKTL